MFVHHFAVFYITPVVLPLHFCYNLSQLCYIFCTHAVVSFTDKWILVSVQSILESFDKLNILVHRYSMF